MTSHKQLALGKVRQGAAETSLCLPLDTIGRHALVTGSTGSGKSAFFLSVMLGVLTRQPHVGVVLVDLKGETAQLLRDRFLPVLAQQFQHIRPERLVAIEPFGPYGVGLNPLRPMPGLSREVQANIVCHLVASLLDDGLGPRMVGILSWLLRAAMEVNGGLHDVLRMLTDERYIAAVAERVQDEEVRGYLRRTFSAEPKASKESLRARLEWLLLLPQVRAMLCASDCVRARDLIESPIVIVDLGGAPQGMAALPQFIGGFIMQLITAAVFARPVTDSTHPVLLFVDEWQALVRSSVADFERLLSQARRWKVGVWLANQTMGQIEEVSHGLSRSLLVNTALRILFQPEVQDLKAVLPLIPISGRCVNPELPDRLLSKQEEKQRLEEQLTQLPFRRAVLADKTIGRADVIRTLSVPFDQTRQRAEALPQDYRERFRRGRFGQPIERLSATELAVPMTQEKEQALDEDATSRETETPVQDVRAPKPSMKTPKKRRTRSARTQRPKLELP